MVNRQKATEERAMGDRSEHVSGLPGGPALVTHDPRLLRLQWQQPWAQKSNQKRKQGLNRGKLE